MDLPRNDLDAGTCRAVTIHAPLPMRPDFRRKLHNPCLEKLLLVRLTKLVQPELDLCDTERSV